MNRLALLLSALIYTNELSEKRLTLMEDRLTVMESLQLFFIPVLVLIGGGTLFALFKLLEVL